MNPPSQPDAETVRAIVAWLRAQGKAWQTRAKECERKFGRDNRATQAACFIFAGYQDHADAIERGEPFA